MFGRILRVTALLTTLILLPQVSSYNTNGEDDYENNMESDMYLSDKKFVRQIHSMMNAYRENEEGGHNVVEKKSLVNTKYRTWKRNADLINALLALPKGMTDAGR